MVLSFVTNRTQVVYKMVCETPLGLTNVEEATSEAADAIDHVDGCAGEPLSNVDREVQEGEGGFGDGPGEFEIGVKGVGKVDELVKLLVGARGSADTVIDVAEEE
eukprot:g31432.t1